MLVTGGSRLGKTSLLRRFAGRGRGQPAPQSPGARAGTTTRHRPGGRGPRRCAGLRTSAARELATAPGRAAAVVRWSAGRRSRRSPAGRLRLLDAIARLLGGRRPTSRWSWCSTTSSGVTPRPWTCCASWSAGRGSAGCCWSARYRAGEATPEVARGAGRARGVRRAGPAGGPRRVEVTELVSAVAGARAVAWGTTVQRPQRRAPVLRARAVPGARRGRGPGHRPAGRAGVVRRSLDALSADCAGLLDVAAVVGSALSVDLLAEVAGRPRPDDGRAGRRAGTRASWPGCRGSPFAHDLYRETVLGPPAATRADAHRRLIDGARRAPSRRGRRVRR